MTTTTHRFALLLLLSICLYLFFKILAYTVGLGENKLWGKNQPNIQKSKIVLHIPIHVKT